VKVNTTCRKFNLYFASDSDNLLKMAGEPKSKRRSGCPVSISLELLGDRWSLLVVRDLMVRGLRTFKDFQESGEGIATNVLADRLQKLEAAGIIAAEADETDGRRVNYRLTEKGIDLAPVLLELLIGGHGTRRHGHRARRSRKWRRIAKRYSPKHGGDGENATRLR